MKPARRWSGAFAAALCLAAACSRPQINAARPHATATPERIDFGESPVLFPVRRSVLLGDGGTVPLHVTGVRIEGLGAQAFGAAAAPVTVSPGSTAELVVLFRPPAAGDFAASLYFDTDDPDQPSFEIPLTGVGTLAGAIALRPEAIDFGRVGEGESAVRQLTVESTGTADLYLGAVGIAPGSADGFAVLGNGGAPGVLAPGRSVTIGLRYSPAAGAQPGPGALRIESSDAARPVLDAPLTASINRAPVPLAQGAVGSDAPRAGQLDTAVGATVRLDGTLTTDPDGDLPLRHRWTLALRPAGSSAAIADPSAAATALRLDAPGAYSVLLEATDGTGLASLSPSRLDLRALPPEQLLVELVWDKVEPDLDLHLIQDGSVRGSEGDCNWINPDPAWFGPAPDLNPHHLGDRLVGYGPETVRWKQPADGVYRIEVVYKADHGAKMPAVGAEVRVFAYGVQIADLRHAFDVVNQVWVAGRIEWPTAKVLLP